MTNKSGAQETGERRFYADEKWREQFYDVMEKGLVDKVFALNELGYYKWEIAQRCRLPLETVTKMVGLDPDHSQRFRLF